MRVAVASVGPWDSWIRAGKSVLPQPLPLTLGSDLSGTVVALGDGVTDLAIGDPVFGVTNKRFTNAYAELAIASAAMIAKRPAGVEHALAASAPVVSVTALPMVFDHAKVVAGQRVLVQGAGGNVGAYAVQLAKHAGAHVTGTGRTRDLEYIRSLGADAVVDTGTTRFEDVVGPIDVVIDTVGGDLQARSLGVIRAGGALVSAVSQPDQDEAARRGVRASFILVDVNRESLTRIGCISWPRGGSMGGSARRCRSPRRAAPTRCSTVWSHGRRARSSSPSADQTMGVVIQARSANVDPGVRMTTAKARWAARFVKDLAALTFENVFNPYADHCGFHDAAARRLDSSSKFAGHGRSHALRQSRVSLGCARPWLPRRKAYGAGVDGRGSSAGLRDAPAIRTAVASHEGTVGGRADGAAVVWRTRSP